MEQFTSIQRAKEVGFYLDFLEQTSWDVKTESDDDELDLIINKDQSFYGVETSKMF